VSVRLTSGIAVDGEGTIALLGEGFIMVNGQRLSITDNTDIVLNDVSSYAVGIPVQYKGIQDNNGDITLALLEVN
jgi:hypothetical protein